MKKKLFFSLLMGLFLCLASSNYLKVNAQTAGTLNFTYTQTAPSGTATKNVMAVWIEDSLTSAFVKTKMRYWSSGTNDHLPSWVANSAQNVTDATTGATRTAATVPTAFGAKTISWDGKGAISGTTVTDGVYKVMIESSYCDPQPANGQHWLLYSFSFKKGPNAVHLTPTAPTNFSNIVIDWVPTGTGIETISANSTTNVYPNPTNGMINIGIQQARSFKIENTLGAVVYEEILSKSAVGLKTIDLSKFENGIYFVKVQSAITKEFQNFKIILNK